MRRPDRTWGRAPVILFTGLVMAVTIGALFLLRPDWETRMRQHLADGNDGAALRIVDQQGALADMSERALADIVELHLRLGRLDRAGAVIGAAIDRYPQSAWPRRHQSELVNTVGTFGARLEWAGDLLDDKGAANADDVGLARALLLADARRRAAADHEIALMEKAQADAGRDGRQSGRLGLLLAAKGRTEEAIAALGAAVEAGGASQQERETLEALLAESGQRQGPAP